MLINILLLGGPRDGERLRVASKGYQYALQKLTNGTVLVSDSEGALRLESESPRYLRVFGSADVALYQYDGDKSDPRVALLRKYLDLLDETAP